MKDHSKLPDGRHNRFMHLYVVSIIFGIRRFQLACLKIYI
jgi:hypothetical protein